MNKALLSVEGVNKSYGSGGSANTVLNNINLQINTNQCLALVGESGSGKSTLGRCILGLESIDAGKIVFDGCDLATLNKGALRALRKRFGVVFQSPLSSLNPRMRVAQLVEEPLLVHKIGTAKERRERVLALLDDVGLGQELATRYPGTLSGGQCQRVAIARGIAAKPDFLVLDEPTAALDVSVQAQIVDLLRELRKKISLSYLFITHDLALVAHIADRVAVLQNGILVEHGTVNDVFAKAQHSYTAELLAAIPDALPPRNED